FDASFVLDEGKVVIVRMTPAVFFAKLEQQFPLPPANEVDDRIVRFEGHPYNHWLTVMRFLQIKCEQGEESRKKWLDVLISRANDNTATEEHRAQALHAMTSFLGLKDRA